MLPQRIFGIDFHIIDSGIILKVQSLDLFLGKIMKGYYRDLYDADMLNIPINLATDHPFIPSCQLYAI